MIYGRGKKRKDRKEKGIVRNKRGNRAFSDQEGGGKGKKRKRRSLEEKDRSEERSKQPGRKEQEERDG